MKAQSIIRGNELSDRNVPKGGACVFKRLFIGCLLGITVAVQIVPAKAEDSDVSEYRARAIRVIDDSATMYRQDEGLLFSSTGPVGKRGIPNVIKQGDVLTVNGDSLKANLIIVTVYHKDMKWQGKYLARKGDVKCLVVESEKDIPSDNERDRLWINVEKCLPIR